jgi:hypothetical protein
MNALGKSCQLLVHKPMLCCKQMIELMGKVKRTLQHIKKMVVDRRTWNGFACEELALNANSKERTAT